MNRSALPKRDSECDGAEWPRLLIVTGIPRHKQQRNSIESMLLPPGCQEWHQKSNFNECGFLATHNYLHYPMWLDSSHPLVDKDYICPFAKKLPTAKSIWTHPDGRKKARCSFHHKSWYHIPSTQTSSRIFHTAESLLWSKPMSNEMLNSSRFFFSS